MKEELPQLRPYQEQVPSILVSNFSETSFQDLFIFLTQLGSIIKISLMTATSSGSNTPTIIPKQEGQTLMAWLSS